MADVRAASRLHEALHLGIEGGADAQHIVNVVVLTGLGRLDQICALYGQLGRGDLPMTVIQNGTQPNERCVVWQD